MNGLQRMVLAVGLLVVCVSILFIPHEAVYQGYNSSRIVARAPAGYAFLTSAPSSAQCVAAIERVRPGVVAANRCSTRIDTTRIGLQLGALATLVAALTLLAGIVRKRQPLPVSDASPSIARQPRPGASPVPEPPRRSSFAEQLRRAMPGLPVSSGDLHEQRPLVITDDVNHVSVEYQVMNYIIEGDRQREYRKTGQQLLHRNGRRIDVLTYVTKPIVAKEWTGEAVSYYFDITAGYDRMRAQFED